MVEQRRAPRTEIAVPCTLTRRRGNPIHAVTQDVGAGGMRVTTDRPLAIDEEVDYELAATHGRARVVRQQTPTCYALRFDAAVDDILEWIAAG